MTLTVNLDEETEREIARKAARLGLTPSEYISRLAKRAVRPKSGGSLNKPNAAKESALSALKEFIGSVHGTYGPEPGVAWSDIEAACDDH